MDDGAIFKCSSLKAECKCNSDFRGNTCCWLKSELCLRLQENERPDNDNGMSFSRVTGLITGHLGNSFDTHSHVYAQAILKGQPLLWPASRYSTSTNILGSCKLGETIIAVG